MSIRWQPTHKLVSWSLTSLFSTNMAISETNQPTNQASQLGYESVSTLLSSTSAITIYYYYWAWKMIFISSSHGGQKTEST